MNTASASARSDSAPSTSAPQKATPPEARPANGAAPTASASSGSSDTLWTPGEVRLLTDPEQFKSYLREYSDQLVVLMCKAKGCRPCKAFERKYERIAGEYLDAVFLSIYGDESRETRKLMVALEVKSTPTFLVMAHKKMLSQHSGIGEGKLRAALEQSKESLAEYSSS